MTPESRGGRMGQYSKLEVGSRQVKSLLPGGVT